ncbi:ABC transporter transmembrane domain-containing protein [Geobacillus stearothermophilus]|uniref:ABC transporter transmembrane domain-containing protein n=1 Tax=Geobacillus stearothermophilus TaxID=1422 RepID=UPI002E216BC3|nr:ABC transporter transmembrane domain-containing protein [Geobacillus stearothermophilus]MED3731716.1 ABC transporter transmembrane domain-containing protein [Geobacillus stearothermophilus]MED3733943.1 ABC transporter transmembrane domain-containing protein [Geobacillus stearothermophilus]MED3740847.1 ABC transporter transmembrane domain-containing protein [Geobacillus stearothermophilus]MED3749973.1 ABC transporter transmembrane domain-containing protein [Geobacillus stearothermophilus]MED
MRVFRDLFWFFRQEKKAYITGIFVLVIVAFLETVPPKVIGLLVDHMKNGTMTKEVLIRWIAVLAAVAAALYGLRYAWRIFIFGSAVKLARQLRNELYQHFTNMSPSFYQRKRIGDLMAHATNDLQAIQQTAGSGILTLVDSVTLGGVVLATMAFSISWKLTLISLLPMPVMAAATSRYGTMLHRRFLTAQAAFSSLNDKVQESVNGIRVIKAFGYEEHDVEAFRRQSEDVVAKNVAVAKIDALFDPTIGLLVGLSFFLAVVFGSQMVLAGELTIGELVSFTTYLGLLIWPMLAFGWMFNIVERGRASYDRVRALLAEQDEINERPDALHISPQGDIEYDVRQFAYPGEAKPALRGIRFQLKRGATLGVVGKTGAGKTTLLRLLLREFDGYDGEIRFGGRDIRDYTLFALRSAIGYVPQDHFLFSASIRDNIAFAKPEAGEDEVVRAARLADIHDDILQFPDGYETVIGERGVSLSGGQKQRLSIARALLIDPEVLIFDDALSAVDAKTEARILAALKQERRGKTTIIAAHRLSAVEHADWILVFDGGRIVQAGTHEQMMAEDGWYRDMHRRQQLEAIAE